MQDKIKVFNALVYTVRPSASLGAAALVFAAYFPLENEWSRITLLMLAASLGSFYCFLVNDIFDAKKDLMNEKSRPIATGAVPLRLAFVSAFICAVGFLGIIYGLLQTHMFFLSILFLVLATFYSKINQRWGFLANVTVAMLAAATQWGVCLIVWDMQLLLSAGFVFFLSIPREMLLDWLDKKGDQASGKSSLPLLLTPKQNQWIVFVLLCLSTISLILWFLLNDRSGSTHILLIAIVISQWFSFFPFLRKADDREALLSVRLTHVTFGLLILALITR